ncbi:MAG: hypothetical protein JXM70_27015 [Pirellulales bacterium]|nr:hypothetical protein [Pirellulales bacterium]
MGVTEYINKLETEFLNQLADNEIPRDLDPNDSAAVQAWFKTTYAAWFLEHRDELLAREWVKRGWAEHIMQPTESGKWEKHHRVKPEYVEEVDAWLQDEIN